MASTDSLVPTAVSAPGKVLLAGGYLILDRKYTGLVFGLDARIHVCVEPITTKSGVTLSEIIVKSPQFKGAHWEYGYRVTEGGGGIVVTPLRASHDIPLSKNVFIETALSFALTYIASHLPSPQIPPASISILADQDYYSNPGTKTSPDSQFLDFNVSLQEAHKTGLGSSAALVTAFTGALLTFYLPKETFDIASDSGLRTLHNLSQLAHCAAQGKIGSGFDIASAVYGSCLYRRFSPMLFKGIPIAGVPSFAPKVRKLVDDTWDVEIRKAAVQMPAGLRLVMCDVDCGSETPGMVTKVMEWMRANKNETLKIWAKLQEQSEALAAELTRLATADREAEGEMDYVRLREIFKEIRSLLAQMTNASGVPIEPPQQTALLDACLDIPGVIGGVVPGAGGYDAIVLLLEDKEEVIAQLKKLLAGWTVDPSVEDAIKIGKVGMLGVREDMVGVKQEDPENYKEWMT